MSSPILFISAAIKDVSVIGNATVGTVAGIPYQWGATLTVVPQAHSDSASLPTPNFYTGRNVAVGNWITSDGAGNSLCITAISSQTETQVVCTLEDKGSFNAISDSTGNLDGLIPNGAGIGAYVFVVNNGVPILGNIPATLPGNLSGTQFANNIQSRFAQSAGIGIDATTGKLDASILPPPVVGSGLPGAVKLPSNGDFMVDTVGNLVLSNSGVTAGKVGNVTVDGKGRVTAIAPIAPADIPTLNWTKIGSGLPTTLAGFKITDAISTASIGVAGGIASLDPLTGKVHASQLPPSVDSIVEEANLAAFPASGLSQTMYIALDTGKTYRWSGSAYVEIVASPGSSDAVIEGTTNLYFTAARAEAVVAAAFVTSDVDGGSF